MQWGGPGEIKGGNALKVDTRQREDGEKKVKAQEKEGRRRCLKTIPVGIIGRVGKNRKEGIA